MNKPRKPEEMDAKDWIILRLLVAAGTDQLFKPEFTRAVEWASEADRAMYSEALHLLLLKRIDLGENPLATCLVIDTGDDQ